jgi:cytidine deaminase
VATRTCAVEDLSHAERDLVAAALEARQHAHAPYSSFAVGAALRAVDGTVYRGCNIEISSYGLTECAERVALFSACAAGAREFEALAVVGPDSVGCPTPPCGACRQVIWDLAGDITVLLANAAGEVEVWRAGELLPEPFGPAHLGEKR